MAQLRHIDHGPFLGLNDDDNKLALRPGELQVASNVFHVGTTLHTRPGFIEEPDNEFQTDDIPTVNRAIDGIFEYRQDFGGVRKLIVAHAGLYYTKWASGGDTALDTVANTIVSSAPATGSSDGRVFAQWRDHLFGAGGAATDDAWCVVDPTVGTPGVIGDGNDVVKLQVEASSGVPSTGSAFTPKLVFEKWNYVFCAQFYEATAGITSSTVATDSNTNPLVVRYSDLGAIDATDIDTLGASFPYSNAIGGPGIGGLSGNWGDWITGFGEYTDNHGDWLIIGTNRRLYSVRQTPIGDRPFAITDEIPNGLVSQRAFVQLGVDSGDAIYMSSQGIHSLRQSQQHGTKSNTFLSWPIRNTFAGLNRARLDQASGAYWPTEGLVLFTVPNGTSTFNNLILALDIKNAGSADLTPENVRWYTWELGGTGHAGAGPIPESVATFASATDSSGVPYIYAGTYSGDVLHVQTDTFADQGTTSASQVDYSIKWRTDERNFDMPGQEKHLADVYTKMTPVGNYSPELTAYFDFGRRPTTRQVSLDAANVTSVWDTETVSGTPDGDGAVWDIDSWSSDFSVASGKQNFEGSGEVLSFEMTHTGVNQPVGIVALAYELAALGEDQGAR
jgi:hypothetical protein